MEELRLKVIEWAKDRGILEKATPASQATKVMEECLELVVADFNRDLPEIMDSIGDVLVTLFIEAELLSIPWPSIESSYKDATYWTRVKPVDILAESTVLYDLIEENDTEDISGNIAFMVFLLNKYSERAGINPQECLQGAYDVISKRKGKMVNGIFVKDK